MMRPIQFIALLLTTSGACAAPADDLAVAFREQVTRRLDVPDAVQRQYLSDALGALHGKQAELGRVQPLVVVDRNPNVQTLLVYSGSEQTGWQLVGAAPVATGRRGSFDHYVTPTGVYDHSGSVTTDYRAEGTKNSKGIRGFGRKGMRVWDFGFQVAQKGWLKREETGPIRMLMHATDPDVLEPRLGTPGSKGCIRIPATLNQFLDRYSVFDFPFSTSGAAGSRPWVLRPDRVVDATPGRYLVVLDSEATARPAWAALQHQTSGQGKRARPGKEAVSAAPRQVVKHDGAQAAAAPNDKTAAPAS